MGAGASTIADYKEAASKSDESSFPEAFAQLKTAVDGFEGDAAAALLVARAKIAADLALATSANAKVIVSGGGGGAADAAAVAGATLGLGRDVPVN